MANSYVKWWRTPAILAIYGAGFWLLHGLAAFWGGGLYSLWFPPAGLRFALIWAFGTRMGLLMVAVELCVQIATGVVSGPGPLFALRAMGIVGPALGYVAGIFLARALERSPWAKANGLSTAPIPLAIAIAIAPVMGVIGSLPWAILGGKPYAPAGIASALSDLATFWVGDLLGVLLIAPPLLWLLGRFRPGERQPGRQINRLRLLECGVLLLLSCAISALAYRMGGGIRLEPLLLCSIWIGLRLGRMAAWSVGAGVCAAVLILSSAGMVPTGRVYLHLLAACIAIASYLVGSYSDVETQLRNELRQRERMLLHAERLKTLRAMSLAVIHEVSQPLSTLAIEARHMRQLVQFSPHDLAELDQTSALVERKSSYLSDLVARMRGFGTPSSDDVRVLPAQSLVDEVAALLAPEARTADVKLELTPTTDATVSGGAIELQQALANLVRNAIAAWPNSTVRIGALVDAGEVFLEVEDRGNGASGYNPGMGVGLMIVRTIVDAHGGRLFENTSPSGGKVFTIALPQAGSYS